MPAFVSFLRLSRPYNALLPVVAIVAGYTIAHGDDITRLILTILLFVILHGVVTVWNDFEDEASDRFNNIHRVRDVRKAGTYRRFRHWMVGLVLTVLMAGILLGRQSELLLMTYILIGGLYNARPAQLSRRPVGSMVCMFLAYGLIPFALGTALGVWHWQAAVLGVAWASVRLSLSLLKDYKDAPGDAKAAKKTFLLFYGGSVVARASISLLIIGLAGVVFVAAHHNATLALAAIVVPAFWLVNERWKLFQHSDYRGLHSVFVMGLRYQLAFDTLVVLWLLTL